MNPKYYLIIALFYCSSSFAQVQRVDTIQCKIETIATLPKSLTEISGMAYTKDGLWVHNDGDNGPFIMLLQNDGTIKSIKKITNAPNYDWEDMAIDPAGNLFVGDIGNNNNNRRELQIYKISKPLATESLRIESEKIEFDYPDQKDFPPKASQLKYDAEAMIFFNDSIFIFSKNRTQPYDGYLRMYKLPAKPGKYHAILSDSILLGGKNMLNSWVTGADISNDGKKLAMLSHDKIWVFETFEGSHFFKGKLHVLKLNHFSQKEAICFDTKGDIFVADEFFEKILGGKLYRITVPK